MPHAPPPRGADAAATSSRALPLVWTFTALSASADAAATSSRALPTRPESGSQDHPSIISNFPRDCGVDVILRFLRYYNEGKRRGIPIPISCGLPVALPVRTRYHVRQMNTVATTNVDRPIGGAGEDEFLSVADAIRSRLFATASPFVSCSHSQLPVSAGGCRMTPCVRKYST